MTLSFWTDVYYMYQNFGFDFQQEEPKVVRNR